MSTPQNKATPVRQARGRKTKEVHGPQKPRLRYRQNWAAYNAAQTHEQQHVADLLRDLCDAIEAPEQHRGRPRIPVGDAVFAAVMKVYGTTSGRRAATDLREYAAMGYLRKAPHYNSVFNALEIAALTPILKALIEESARPLRAIEADFAVDSSGFSTKTFARCFDHKYGKPKGEMQWLKAHIMVGVTTNVVTSIEVTAGYANDSPFLPQLLRSTTARFNVTKLSADKGYSAKSNVVAIEEAGAFPLIPFKSTTRGYGPPAWRRSFDFFKHNKAEFMQHYHKRSNVETTFAMIKAKFGGYVRSRAPQAQVNEVLCKVLCHNLCCLVHSAYEGVGAA